jgi:saccharopine dehydrogenase-like NADP-dependent oxidoreductase
MPTRSTIASLVLVHQSHKLKTYIEPPTPRDKLSPKPITSPSKKKTKTYAKVQVANLKDDEEKTHSYEVGCVEDKKTTSKSNSSQF